MYPSGSFNHARMSLTRQKVTFALRSGRGNLRARTRRHSVDLLNGISPHITKSESLIEASSGSASNGQCERVCFIVVFLELSWKPHLKSCVTRLGLRLFLLPCFPMRLYIPSNVVSTKPRQQITKKVFKHCRNCVPPFPRKGRRGLCVFTPKNKEPRNQQIDFWPCGPSGAGIPCKKLLNVAALMLLLHDGCAGLVTCNS